MEGYLARGVLVGAKQWQGGYRRLILMFDVEGTVFATKYLTQRQSIESTIYEDHGRKFLHRKASRRAMVVRSLMSHRTAIMF